jgi:hypothetical protein
MIKKRIACPLLAWAVLLAGCFAPCSGSAFLILLKGYAVSEAELGLDGAGRPMLKIDGAPAPLVTGLAWHTYPAPAVRAFRDSGVKTVTVFANLGFYSSALGYVAPIEHMRPFWTGPAQYNDSDVNKILAEAVTNHPNCKIMVWLAIEAYPAFGVNYPDEVIRNDKGEALIADGHFLRFDSVPPVTSNQERYGISFFSQQYRQECSAMLAEFIRTVEASPYGAHVIGYLIGGGQDMQMYSWSPPNDSLKNTPDNWGDYSPAAINAFIGWLSGKYAGQVTNLNQSWDVSLTDFAQAAPPPAADLTGVSAFHNPSTEMRAYDWKRFLAEGRAEFLDVLAEAVKNAATEKVIVGASGGDGGHRRDNTSVSQLLRSNHLDFFLHQAAYAVRIPPSTGGINALLDSYTANGKLFFTDMDHRLWTGIPVEGTNYLGGGVTYTDVSVGRAADMTMQRDMWRREYARLWISGNNGAWFNNMGAPEEYANAEIQGEMRFLQDVSARLVEQRSTQSVCAAAAEVAFVFDEAAVDYARSALSEYHGAGMFRQWAESLVSGVPIRYYYAQDLRDGKIPPAKMYVLQNLIDIDPVLATRIQALRESGATLVFLQGTGMAQLARGQSALLDQALGIQLRFNATNTSATIATNHPLLASNVWNTAVSSLETARLKEVEGIALTTYDTNASVLSVYPASHQPAAAAVVDTNGAKIVFVGAYNLSSDAISRLAAYANAWRVSPPGNVIEADDQFLMIHPLTSGNITVVLKSPAVLTEMEPGTNVSSLATSHTLNLTAGHTYLFEQRRALLYSENFESYNTNTTLNGQGSWSAAASNPKVIQGVGSDTTKVLSNGSADGVATKAITPPWGSNTMGSLSFDTYIGSTITNTAYVGIGKGTTNCLGFYLSGANISYRSVAVAGGMTTMLNGSGGSTLVATGKWYNITANFTLADNTITDVWLTNQTDGGAAVQLYFGATNTATRVYTEAGDEAGWNAVVLRMAQNEATGGRVRMIDNIKLIAVPGP